MCCIQVGRIKFLSLGGVSEMMAQFIPLALLHWNFWKVENWPSLEIEELKTISSESNLPIGDTVTLSPSFRKTLKNNS